MYYGFGTHASSPASVTGTWPCQRPKDAGKDRSCTRDGALGRETAEGSLLGRVRPIAIYQGGGNTRAQKQPPQRGEGRSPKGECGTHPPFTRSPKVRG